MAAAESDKDAAVSRAEQAVAALAAEYPACARADLVRLQDGLAVLHALPGRGGEAEVAILRQMFAIAHDMKGQAATFGYPLLGRIANAICRLLEAEQHLGAHGLDHLAVLIKAMVTVLDRRLGGDGGSEGSALLRGLDDRRG